MTLLFATLKQMKKPWLLLLIPCTINLGMMQGFFFGEFAAGWVACPPYFGVSKIGLIFMTYGSCHALSSLFFGFLAKYTGRQFFEGIMGMFAGPAIVTFIYADEDNPFQDDPFSLFLVWGLFGLFMGLQRLNLNGNYVRYSCIYIYII